jgi:hypothetical protein
VETNFFRNRLRRHFYCKSSAAVKTKPDLEDTEHTQKGSAIGFPKSVRPVSLSRNI